MAGSVNKVILIGNLGRDPEVRRLNSGEPVCNFSLATTESWRDKQTGERRDRTEWHNVVIFNENLSRIAEQYLKKGSKVYVEGQLQTRKYQDKTGQERERTEVVLQRFRGELTLLDGRGGGGGGGGDFGGGGGDYGGEIESPRGGGSAGGRSGGSDFGRSSPMEQRPAKPGGGRHTDMDDDIPF